MQHKDYEIIKIGEINEGIDGTAIYFRVGSNCNEPINLESLREAFADHYCYESRHPGGKFCDMVTATWAKYGEGCEAIVTVYESYDC